MKAYEIENWMDKKLRHPIMPDGEYIKFNRDKQKWEYINLDPMGKTKPIGTLVYEILFNSDEWEEFKPTRVWYMHIYWECQRINNQDPKYQWVQKQVISHLPWDEFKGSYDKPFLVNHVREDWEADE